MKTSKKEKKRLIIISSVIAILILVLVTSTYGDWLMIMENTNKTELLEQEYANLIDKETSLKSDVIKLKDPEYVMRYAKEKYHYSSEGDVIILMEDED